MNFCNILTFSEHYLLIKYFFLYIDILIFSIYWDSYIFVFTYSDLFYLLSMHYV